MSWKVLGVVDIHKEMLAFLKSSIDRFGSLQEFQTAYKEFKETYNANNTKDIQEINKEFRKEFGIPDRMTIPSNLQFDINSI